MLGSFVGFTKVMTGFCCRTSTSWTAQEFLKEICLPLLVLAVGMFCSIAALSTLGND